ncbi:ferredoxin-type protein NapF [Vibrio hippocampi]|uniref:Ferredoxin-type protein NapF n=1 Tax=Vibrio hippocampi TaxID=654686 RepID=A0ABN8DLA3_9VIBR|nr:ferredoxin-type protein NapF [Vibrio hippocampi]CAH0530169.1 Ferredoxin-type protein NapF [Vibrio hippocampi]
MVDVSRRVFFTRKSINYNMVRLPWIKEAQRFTELCTRCGQCEQACETQIIVKGDGGFPQVDFSLDECTFCYKCAEICPEPIFSSEQQPAWDAKAQISDTCLATQNIECRSCGDSCEPMAIRFQLRAGGVAQPQLELESCNGCGACVSTCPSNSISVSNE